jgi:hypothetical protein
MNSSGRSVDSEVNVTFAGGGFLAHPVPIGTISGSNAVLATVQPNPTFRLVAIGRGQQWQSGVGGRNSIPMTVKAPTRGHEERCR